MAGQKFSNSFREALWETFGKKCFHCAGELLLVDMEIDHIIPEHFHHGDPDERDAVLSKIGLPPTFEILGDGNLAPAVGNVTARKVVQYWSVNQPLWH